MRHSMSTTETITEIDLSGQTLKTLYLPAPADLSIPLVKKLSLQGNKLVGPSIKPLETLQVSGADNPELVASD